MGTCITIVETTGASQAPRWHAHGRLLSGPLDVGSLFSARGEGNGEASGARDRGSGTLPEYIEVATPGSLFSRWPFLHVYTIDTPNPDFTYDSYSTR